MEANIRPLYKQRLAELRLEIEIWSDILCPFCIMGKRNLMKALEQFEHRENVKLVWRSFELNPNADKQNLPNLVAHLAMKYQKSNDEARAMIGHMTQTAARVGLNFRLDRAITTNSFDAHRLIYLAKNHGKQDEVADRLFSAYLCRGEEISSHETLIAIGAEFGIDKTEVQEMLNSARFTAEIRLDEEQAQQIGIRGVPFFLIAREYAIAGAQPSGQLLQTLRRAWNETHSNEAEA